MRDYRRAPKGGVLACALGVVTGVMAVLGSGCGLNQNGVPPPLDHISFPGSALVDPYGHWLYVANSNSDLRYNNGTLVSVDLDHVAADRAKTWSLCPSADYIRPDDPDTDYCCWNYLDHTILDCDERKYIDGDKTVIIGSFAAGMVFQSFEDPACPQPQPSTTPASLTASATTRHPCYVNCEKPKASGRLFLGVRGNSTITYTDVAGSDTTPSFSCKEHPDGKVGCTVSEVPDPPAGTAAVLLPDEPYSLSLDPDSDLLYVGHLRGDIAHADTGGVSLFDVSGSSTGGEPVYIGPSRSVFSSDANGQFGITSLTRNASNGLTYATSRYTTSAIGIVTPLNAMVGCLSPQSSKGLFIQATSDVFTTPLVGTEIRGIQFMPDSPRAYLLQRVPPALVGFDIANGAGGLFGNIPSDILETCQSPTFLQIDPTKTSPDLYVTCFDAGQVYVFDPAVPRLTNVVDAGRGPAGLAFAPGPSSVDKKLLAYVVGFSANNISVLDLTPGSPTRYHVIQRIGFSSPNPR
jgi:hypothetical protein